MALHKFTGKSPEEAIRKAKTDYLKRAYVDKSVPRTSFLALGKYDTPEGEEEQYLALISEDKEPLIEAGIPKEDIKSIYIEDTPDGGTQVFPLPVVIAIIEGIR